MNHRHFVPAALLSLLTVALPAHAQTGAEAFNPFAMLAPLMTQLGAMLVPMMAPMMAPMNAQPNGASPAVFNPFNPAMFNQLMQPAAYGAPAGVVPFSGLQSVPQAYGMPAGFPSFPGLPTTNAIAGMPAASPFPAVPQFQMPVLPSFPVFPGFPFPVAR